MLNELLASWALWLDAMPWSTALHESLYLHAWVESTHVLALTLFLGMLLIIDLRMLGLAFADVPAPLIAERLDKPMLVGLAVMVATGLMLYFATPVRSTQSIWFRIKVALLIAAGVNALLFRARMKALQTEAPRVPKRLRVSAGLSLVLWSGVVVSGRAIAYDWFDCHKQLPRLMHWAAGCLEEMTALDGME